MSVGIKKFVLVETTGYYCCAELGKIHFLSRGEMDSRDEATAIFDCYGVPLTVRGS